MAKLNVLLLVAVLGQTFAIFAQHWTIARLEEYADELRMICHTTHPMKLEAKYDIPAWRAP